MFLKKIEAKPAALLIESRTQQKSFLFLLEEKIRRAHIRKSEENFFVGWRASARGGGAASLVPFKVGSREVYNYSTNERSEFSAQEEKYLRVSREVLNAGAMPS